MTTAVAGDGNWWGTIAGACKPGYREASLRAERLRSELERLPSQPVSQQSERLGWHSHFAGTPTVTKWLQVDLQRSQSFDAVVLVPVDVAYGTHPGPGFGFPLRYRVEASDDAAFSEPRLVAAYDDVDFPNPGNAPVFLAAPPGAKGRFIRVTATRLWPRGDFALVALGEIFVLRDGLDLAVQAPVTASDSYDNAPTWEPANATDGQSVLGPPVRIESAPGNGWHAQIATSPEVVKWVQVDLGAAMPLNEVRLYPARPKDFPARRGFGFPVRFRVEAANDPDFAQPTLLQDETRADFVNPAENPVIIPVHEVNARYLRVTATRLWERSNDFIFALAELEAWAGGRNVALGAKVISLDTIESGTWSQRFLVDGFNSQGRILDLTDWLRGLSRRREVGRELSQVEALRSRELTTFGTTLAKWFSGFLLVLVVTIVWRWRRRARARERELAALRQRIADDLHDEIGSNLGSIALLSQMALRQEGDGRADLAEINRVARETAVSMRDIVWLIKPGGPDGEDFVVRLRETAGALLAGLEWQFDSGGLRGPLTLEWKREVLLFFKEALYNVRRHASARTASIRLADAGGEFVLEIADDGVGFHVNGGSTGLGLASQRRRAQALGGELQIESEPGHGTRVTLRVKGRHSIL